MNTLKTDEARPMLANQLRWFLVAIAVQAWRWRKPFAFLSEERVAEQTAKAQEECEILINALIYGVMTRAFVEPVEIDFYPIFDDFFASPTINEKDSVHLAEILAGAIGKALEF